MPTADRGDLDAEKGDRLYRQYCAFCHGEAGKGDGTAAAFLVTKPRDFSVGVFKFRTTNVGALPMDADLFRTITAGFPSYGMPSFSHLTEKERWALVAAVKKRASAFETMGEPPAPIEIAPTRARVSDSVSKGKKLFHKAGCTQCHGSEGRGDGPGASVLRDVWRNPLRPRDFTSGPAAFKAGSRAVDIVRTLSTGIGGTPMPVFSGTLPPDDLWNLAYYVESLASSGEARGEANWALELWAREGTRRRGIYRLEDSDVEPAEENWDPKLSAKYQSVSTEAARKQGCLSCHEGIEAINEKMQPYLVAMGGGDGRACVVCHEGNAGATTKAEAHRGIYPNPGNMWVVSLGLGCGKCHSNTDALTTLQDLDLPRPVGGSLMQVVSTATDPSGLTGSNHVYRMQRGLMSLEYGKASHTLSSNGVVPKGEYRYADFDMDDPDGAVPSAGSEAYKQWIERALAQNYIKRITHSEMVPTFDQGVKLWKDEVKASFADYYRKECARCHIWEEGRRKRGDFRAGGCAACHVLYTNDGRYEGNDPTIPKEKGKLHPVRHQITVNIPAAQCNHCHTRGKRIGTTFVGGFEFDYKGDGKAIPFDKEGNPQEELYTKEYLKVREDVHFTLGIQCGDCHTSIDVHGDGNIYPTTLHQVEIQCADCHGTPSKYPWELPVGYGHKVELEGQRGVYKKEGTEYLLTARGNPRKNLVRRGEKAVLTSLFDGKEHPIPLLKEKNMHNTWKTEQGRVAMAVVSQHLEKLECYTCHSTWAPQCYGCHTKYDRREKATDWLMTAMNFDAGSGKQRITKTQGKVVVENRSFLRWEDPILGVNLKGKVSPIIPGCQVFWTYIDKKGKTHTLNKPLKTLDGFSSATLAPVQPHANSMPARTCESCHTNPKSIGYGTANSRSQGALNGGAPMFQNLAEGYFGDLPGAKTSKWQVPKIEEFPYALDQLVTRDGSQVQNMPHLEDHPLTREQRNKVEREGLCIACHKHYNSALWDKIRAKVGQALTPAQHDSVVEQALKSLAR